MERGGAFRSLHAAAFSRPRRGSRSLSDAAVVSLDLYTGVLVEFPPARSDGALRPDSDVARKRVNTTVRLDAGMAGRMRLLFAIAGLSCLFVFSSWQFTHFTAVA